MAWTDEMVEELKRLWSEGVTTGEIGRRLNISKNSIVGKVHRLGLSGRPSPIKKKGDEPETPKKAKSPAKEKEPKKAAPAKTSQEKPKEVQQKPAPKPEPKVEKQPVPAKTTPLEEDDIKLAKSISPKVESAAGKRHVSLTELDNHTCRWPIGDPKDENFHFCGRKIRLGQTYCEEHAAIAYVKPGKK